MNGTHIDKSGKRFDRLLVIDRAPSQGGLTRWNCLCDCGKSITVFTGSLQPGRERSCGCAAKCNKNRNVDLIGQKFGRLTVLSKSSKGFAIWKCKCDCGAEVEAKTAQLLSRRISCGCASIAKATHSMSKTPMYQIWLGMMQRCTNPNNHAWQNYGGRGITVCERWRSDPNAFAADMGDRPHGMSLDRIDNNKGYCPENCRWATKSEQNYNTRSNPTITIDGETMYMWQAAAKFGVRKATIMLRIKAGWPADMAAKTKPLKGKQRRPHAIS